METCFAGAGHVRRKVGHLPQPALRLARKTGLAKGLGVRNADQADITAALTQGVDPALNQRSANAVIDDIERSGVLKLFTCVVDRTVGPSFAMKSWLLGPPVATTKAPMCFASWIAKAPTPRLRPVSARARPT